jgi:hypothetical protein
MILAALPTKEPPVLPGADRFYAVDEAAGRVLPGARAVGGVGHLWEAGMLELRLGRVPATPA